MEPVVAKQGLKGGLSEAGAVGRVEIGPVEAHGRRLDAGGVAPDEAAAAVLTKVADVGLDAAGGVGGLLDEASEGGTAREGFEADGARAREQVEDDRALNPSLGFEDVEQGFSRPFGRRPDGLPFRHGETAVLVRSCGDAGRAHAQAAGPSPARLRVRVRRRASGPVSGTASPSKSLAPSCSFKTFGITSSTVLSLSEPSWKGP